MGNLVSEAETGRFVSLFLGGFLHECVLQSVPITSKLECQTPNRHNPVDTLIPTVGRRLHKTGRRPGVVCNLAVIVSTVLCLIMKKAHTRPSRHNKYESTTQAIFIDTWPWQWPLLHYIILYYAYITAWRILWTNTVTLTLHLPQQLCWMNLYAELSQCCAVWNENVECGWICVFVILWTSAIGTVLLSRRLLIHRFGRHCKNK